MAPPAAAASAARTCLATGAAAAPGDDGAALPFAGDEHEASSRTRRRAKTGEHGDGNGGGGGLMLLRTPPPPSRSSPLLRLTSQPNGLLWEFVYWWIGERRSYCSCRRNTRLCGFPAIGHASMQQGHEARARETELAASTSSLSLSLSLSLSQLFFPSPDAILRALWYGAAVCAEQLSCSLARCSAFLFGAHGEMGSSEGEHWQRGARLAATAAMCGWVTEKDGIGSEDMRRGRLRGSYDGVL